MTQNTTMIVALVVRQQGNTYYVTSSNLDGLNVCGHGIEATYQSVVKVIEALFKHNWGFEVDVLPATTDGKEFPKTSHVFDKVVVMRKAA